MSLQVEAGANDGLALPFVLFGGLLATLPAGEVLGHWVVDVGHQVGIAVAAGAAVRRAHALAHPGAGVSRLTVTVSVLGQAVTSVLAVHGYSEMAGTEVAEGDEVDLEGRLP